MLHLNLHLYLHLHLHPHLHLHLVPRYPGTELEEGVAGALGCATSKAMEAAAVRLALAESGGFLDADDRDFLGAQVGAAYHLLGRPALPPPPVSRCSPCRG